VLLGLGLGLDGRLGRLLARVLDRRLALRLGGLELGLLVLGRLALLRVGANSPSLWPTIASLTNTGTCLRPSWTAIVWPTISGKIVDARDQVLTMVRWLAWFMASMRAMRRSSTHGPFLLERLID
jgi:hypothetical protein